MSKLNIFNRLFAGIGNIYGTCAMMGNIDTESDYNSMNMQNSYEKKLGMNNATYTQAVDNGTYTNFVSDRVGYGLCQWTSAGRKAALFNFAKANGCSIGDENMQCDFILHELNSKAYKKVLEVLRNATSIKEASDYVCKKYERPADQSTNALANRTTNGMKALAEFAKELSAKEKKPMKICIDAGHGLFTSGKRCKKSLDPNETREWKLNSRIADKLGALLAAYNCEVLRVDDTTGKTDTSLANRCAKANSWGADVYISIHHNAGIKGGSGGGTVVYYYSSKAERNKQAQALYNAVVGLTGLTGNRSSKVIKKAFYVVKRTNAPAFLIENGFMDSSTDVPIILSEAHADKTARGLLNFLIGTFGLKEKSGSAASPEASKPTEEESGAAFAPYFVQIATPVLNVRAGAGTKYNKVTSVKMGEVYTITEEKVNGSTTWGKLKSGAGWISLKYTKKI